MLRESKSTDSRLRTIQHFCIPPFHSTSSAMVSSSMRFAPWHTTAAVCSIHTIGRQGGLKTCQRWCEEMASRLLKASRRCIPTWRRSMIFASGSRVMRKQPWPRRCKEVLDRGLTNGSSWSYPASNSTSRPILWLGLIWLRAAGDRIEVSRVRTMDDRCTQKSRIMKED
jgi:hypothetical protein